MRQKQPKRIRLILEIEDDEAVWEYSQVAAEMIREDLERGNLLEVCEFERAEVVYSDGEIQLREIGG